MAQSKKKLLKFKDNKNEAHTEKRAIITIWIVTEFVHEYYRFTEIYNVLIVNL